MEIGDRGKVACLRDKWSLYDVESARSSWKQLKAERPSLAKGLFRASKNLKNTHNCAFLWCGKMAGVPLLISVCWEEWWSIPLGFWRWNVVLNSCLENFRLQAPLMIEGILGGLNQKHSFHFHFKKGTNHSREECLPQVQITFIMKMYWEFKCFLWRLIIEKSVHKASFDNVSFFI